MERFLTQNYATSGRQHRASGHEEGTATDGGGNGNTEDVSSLLKQQATTVNVPFPTNLQFVILII